jgi:hypothetical protein
MTFPDDVVRSLRQAVRPPFDDDDELAVRLGVARQYGDGRLLRAGHAVAGSPC